MAVSLQKGQKISLTKERPGLSQVIIGLGWDAKNQKASLFSKTKPFDCDASVLALSNKKLTNNSDVIYYGNLSHPSGAITHLGDNLTGDGDGDDEQIIVDFSKMPPSLDSLIVVVNIYQSTERKQHFGNVKNAFIRIVDPKNNIELCRYNLTDDYSNLTALIFGELYKKDSEWRFNAIGQGTTDPTLNSLIKKYH
ncbi:TerD family protein [Candidatus Epulonipiscium viviparus]|uniref:TerD family protein n=1 Tax=Candidatus Epulonipiscium viviparus TaxID=420336 RepID=UPI00016C0D80|nr:TerD family protein [Candidatus Epulopiscium viviparus]